jgi:chemotaxis signal transduction protein
MSIAASDLAERAAELRSTFDRAFAVPLRAKDAAKTDLIAIRVGSEPCAIRLTDIAGLFADRKITRVPSGKSALLGIAGFRGALVPAYSLGILLGLSGTPAPRWLVIATAAPVAFAFDTFEGHLRVSADAIMPRQSLGDMQRFAPNFIRAGDLVRPVVDVSAAVTALGASETASAAPSKE